MTRIGPGSGHRYSYGSMKSQAEQHSRNNSDEQRFCQLQLRSQKSTTSPPAASAFPLVDKVLKSLTAGYMAGIRWSGSERHWRCRLVNGPFAGLVIDVFGKDHSGGVMSLIPCNDEMYRDLLMAIPEIKQAIEACSINEIRIINADNSLR